MDEPTTAEGGAETAVVDRDDGAEPGRRVDLNEDLTVLMIGEETEEIHGHRLVARHLVQRGKTTTQRNKDVEFS
jgi:hypothetical protein